MKNGSYTVQDCLCRVVAYNGSLQMAHWLANTETNEHKALGELYDSMIDEVDKLAEVYMGKYGMVTFPDDCVVEDITKAPCSKGLILVGELQKHFTQGKDDDLLNILADMQSALHKAKYLLKEDKKEDVVINDDDEKDEEKTKPYFEKPGAKQPPPAVTKDEKNAFMNKLSK